MTNLVSKEIENYTISIEKYYKSANLKIEKAGENPNGCLFFLGSKFQDNFDSAMVEYNKLETVDDIVRFENSII